MQCTPEFPSSAEHGTLSIILSTLKAFRQWKCPKKEARTQLKCRVEPLCPRLEWQVTSARNATLQQQQQ